ncbi:CPBP family intramembrane glutamic endopeptidase [uncultured Streptococcus sp.]|uniref:CPBP family intramembrane glutamic endopeptidase n=1 Tax=uncultured Streptococcus sp. TaxID=83427 RepID=UPI00265A225E|nr:CPBP family intramembrane glutamic endopeptidase [uncultured Streptococcus sp.]
MHLFMSKLVSGILELIIVSFIPFMTWLIWRRKKVGFFDWIGLKKVQTKNISQLLQIILGMALVFLLFSVVLFSWFDPSKTATADFAGKGIGALPAILAYAILGTALPEEIFFRGFLLKRLQGKLGFLGANLVQSLIFGLIHALMFIQLIGFLKAVLIFAFISLIAYVFGAINEKKAGGSILPSFFIHAFANTAAGLCLAMSLF